LDETWVYQNGQSICRWIHARRNVDNLHEQHGVEVLRLPPYHCEFNPIEMAWGFCKGYYNKHLTEKFALPA
ncbi:unnamed protein product, partial [Tenebrio molitor]